MDEATGHEVNQWLMKADHDIRSAKRLLIGDSDGPLLDTGGYHCQQAAEKSIKAYLTAHAVYFPKVHLLMSLITLCQDVDPSFGELSEAAAFLTPFATEFRYPGDVLVPSSADAEQALQYAQHVLSFVKRKLQEE